MQEDAENAVEDTEAEGAAPEPEAPKLELQVQIASRGACQRHVTVTVSRDDIERYMGNAFKDLTPKAAVPGFRPGRAPRKLVESRFKKDVTEQIKGSLVLDSLQQISEDYDLSPISEPDFDPMSIVVPDDGPMTFEFDIEVRPEFDMPNWKGLKLTRLVHTFTDADVDRELRKALMRFGKLIPKEGGAQVGDFIVTTLTFKDGDAVLSTAANETIRIRKLLSFRDGNLAGFDKLMAGVTAGESRVGELQLTADAPNPQLRGKKVQAVFDVQEVKSVELPDLGSAVLEELGGFTSEAELRVALRASLERKLAYAHQQRARDQIQAGLTVSANWDLPPAMLRKQYGRELERHVLELRRNGFSETEIRSHENQLRQNARASTERALKQHFILERIAEEEKIEDLPQDYDDEIRLIAEQSDESPRRVRAKLEKRGLMDVLRNQIVERKAMQLIMDQAIFTDVPYEIEPDEYEAIDQAAGGGDDHVDIPEAHYSDAAQSMTGAGNTKNIKELS